MTLLPSLPRAAGLSLLLLAAPAAAEERVADRIAAVVNSTVLSLSDIYNLGGDFIEERCAGRGPSCFAESEREVLDALIRRTLQQQTLRDLNADVTPTEVDGAINTVIKDNNFPDREALRAEVERSGLAWEDYRAELRAQIREMRFNDMVLRSRVTIPEDELRDAYRRLVRDVEPPKVVRLAAAATRLPTDPTTWPDLVAEARAAIAQVRDGSLTWEQLSQTWDGIGMAAAFEGQTFRARDLADALSKAVAVTEPGDLTEPVIASGILYILRVDFRGEGEPEVASYEDARPTLEQKLFEERMTDALEEWERRARNDASIRILLADPALDQASELTGRKPRAPRADEPPPEDEPSFQP